jgi:hypothetical protein
MRAGRSIEPRNQYKLRKFRSSAIHKHSCSFPAFILCSYGYYNVSLSFVMNKILILGPCGAGKTTFADTLSSQLTIKVFHLDRFFWTRNWKRKSTYERMEILEKLALGEKRWIIEGSYLRSSEPSLREADTIIFLDLPSLLCLRRVIKRHHENRGLPRRDIPEGCADRFTFRHILKTLAFPFHGQKRIKQILSNCSTQNIITLHSPKEVEAFLVRQKRIENEANRTYIPVSTTKESLIATR